MIKKAINYYKDYVCDYLIVNCVNLNKLYIMKTENRIDINDWLDFSDKDNYKLISKTKKTMESRTIFKNGKDTNIRFRLVLNNGITAFIGLNPRTKNSILTIKLQLDNVFTLVNNSKAIKIDYKLL